MNKRIKIFAVNLAVMLALTGCGNQIPDMTEEQMQMVGEYAAMTLLKYDADHRSRLVTMDEIEAHDAKEKKLQELREQQQQATSEAGQMKPVDDTPTIAGGQETGIENTIGFEEFYGLPEGVTISYQGEEVRDAYSGETNVDAFSLEATPGKKLLILNFLLENQSGNDQSIDLFSKTAIYRVTVNGTYTRGALTTMLTDDMSTYVGTLAADESKNVVLIIEIEKNMADSISSISLSLKNESKTGTILLK